MNRITIEFTTCEMLPANGYTAFYRKQGSNDAYKQYPDKFLQSPAVLDLTEDPDGTQYVGYLIADCTPAGTGSGNWGEQAPVVTWRGANGYCETEKVCPAGYTLSADGLTCTKVETQAPVTSETPIHAAASTNGAYSDLGMLIYNPGFSLNGTGVVNNTSTNAYWSNASSNLTDGPMNRNGIWVDNDGDGQIDALGNGQQLSVSFSLTVPVAKTYYIGLGGDNQIMLSVNNVTVVNRNNASDVSNFKYWNVYPVTLNAGYNLITATGTGDGSVQDCLAMEIYNNTAQQIRDATSDSSLIFLFRTKDVRGGSLQIVQCAAGYSPIDNGDGSFVCQRVSQQASTQQNTGTLLYANRERLNNGSPDGFSEPNTQTGGLGPYIASIPNSQQCT